MIVYIYDIKTLELTAKPVAPSYLEFKSNPFKFYPNWNTKNHLASETLFQDPILIDNQIREKTREEKIILDNKLDLLADGEYVENNEIIVVQAPDNLFKKYWNKENNLWEEGATKEEIDNEVNRLFDEYIALDEQKQKYEANKFPTFSLEIKIAENIMKRDYLLSLFNF